MWRILYAFNPYHFMTNQLSVMIFSNSYPAIRNKKAFAYDFSLQLKLFETVLISNP